MSGLSESIRAGVCARCGGVLIPLGDLGAMRYYRCRDCANDYGTRLKRAAPEMGECRTCGEVARDEEGNDVALDDRGECDDCAHRSAREEM